MSDQKRIVVAVARARSGKEQELKAHLEGVARASWDESGVVTYAVHQIVDSPGEFMMVEVYASDAAFEDHLATDHVASILADMPDLIEGELLVYQGHAADFSAGPKGGF